METRARELGRIAAFEGLPPEQIEVLARLAVRRKFSAGAQVFAEGDPPNGFHVVLDGRIRIYKLGLDGKEQILHIWGPGEPVGEAAAVEGFPFPAHAEAMEATTTLFLSRAGLVDEIGRNPGFALALLSLLSRRLRRFAGLIESLSLKEVPGRLAAYLLVRAERSRTENRVTLDVTKRQLAALLGTIPEPLSRVLGRMTREGIIEAEGARTILIRDAKALRELAEGERRLG